MEGVLTLNCDQLWHVGVYNILAHSSEVASTIGVDLACQGLRHLRGSTASPLLLLSTGRGGESQTKREAAEMGSAGRFHLWPLPLLDLLLICFTPIVACVYFQWLLSSAVAIEFFPIAFSVWELAFPLHVISA